VKNGDFHCLTSFFIAFTMNYMLKKLRLLFLFVVFFILSFFVFGTNYVCASNIFFDDFDYRDDSRWDYVLNGGSADFVDGVLTLESVGKNFPVVYSKLSEVFSPSMDTSFEVRFRYNSLAPMGDGISIGYTGASSYPFYQFSLWQDTAGGSTFMYNDFSLSKYGRCDRFVEYGDLNDRQYWPLQLSLSVWHILQIKREGSLYKVYLDGEILHATRNGQCLPPNIILGNPLRGGGEVWNSLSIDYVKIFSVDPESEQKIVILPGLGASWNGRAIVYNETVEADDWVMTPFVKTYDGLISALGAKGLKKNSDFHVWNYDWRQSIEDIVDDLDSFVGGIAESGEKVDLVGHSLGGLVARVWSQKNLDKVDKVISLGSPHYGVVAAYDAWSGGKVSDDFDIRSIALNVLLQLQKENNQTKLDTIRAYAPVLQDLLPTVDFAKMGRRVLSVSSLESQNTYLMNKYSSVEALYDNLVAMVGRGEKTKEWIVLKRRSVFDEVLGLWPDGKVRSYIWADGDGMVLGESAKFDGDAHVEVTANHGQMVNELTDEVFDELDLGEVSTALVPVQDLSSHTVFFVGSPVDMRVECDGDIYIGNNGFVLIDGGSYSSCQLFLSATDSGTYHLVMGRANSQDWYYFEGGGGLLLDEMAEEYLYKLVKRDLEVLMGQYDGEVNLTRALVAVEQRNLDGLIEAVFDFRKEKEEMPISSRILTNIELLLMRANEGAGRTQSRSWYLKAMRAKSMVDRKVRLLRRRRRWEADVFGAASYKIIEEKVNHLKKDWRSGDYGELMARAILVLELLKEVL